MTQEQIQQLHAAVHKAVIVEGKAQTWESIVYFSENRVQNVTVNIVRPKQAATDELCDILRQSGFSLLSLRGSIHGEWRAAQ